MRDDEHPGGESDGERCEDQVAGAVLAGRSDAGGLVENALQVHAVWPGIVLVEAVRELTVISGRDMSVSA